MKACSEFYKNISDHQSPVYMIAEAGINHNGNLDTAMELIDVASEAGADAVKFQTFVPEKLAVTNAPMANYQRHNLKNEQTQLEMLTDFQLKFEHHSKLLERCRERQIEFLSTPFEEESADFLYKLGLTAFKIPSGEITNLPFLKHLGKMGKPLILSTGMSNLADVETAISTLEESGATEITILHCVSQYPAPIEETNLRAIKTLRQAFNYPVGFSDHSSGIEIALAAVSLGARVVEKHFTLSRNMSGPDHKASLEPKELVQLVSYVRNIEKALGDGKKRQMPCEINTAKVARKSIFSKHEIAAGQEISMDNIVIKRPGTGIAPIHIDLVLGKKAKCNLAKDTQIQFNDIE